MKSSDLRPMPLRRLRPIFFISLTTVACLLPLDGAESEKQPASTGQAAPGMPPIIPEFQFGGGTLKQLVMALEKDRAFPINLIIDEGVAEFKVPGFTVRNVDANAFGQTIGHLLSRQGAAVVTAGSGGPDSYPTFVVMAPDRPKKPVAKNLPPAVIQCLSLAALLEHFSPEQVADAIRTAWSLDSSLEPSAASLKYHPETQLLFVAGHNPMVVDVALQVVKTLTEVTQPTRQERVAEEIARRRAMREESIDRQREQAGEKSTPPN